MLVFEHEALTRSAIRRVPESGNSALQAIKREGRITVPSNLPQGIQSAMRYLGSTILTRFPTIWRAFHRNRLLAAARQDDSTTNARTTPPPDEFIDLCCVWGVEFYTPAYMESLIDNLDKLGWRHTEGTSSPAEWVRDMDYHRRARTHMRIRDIFPISDAGCRSTTGHELKLPPHVKNATMVISTLTPSLVCIVMCFVFDEEFGTRIDRSLRQDRRSRWRKRTRWLMTDNPRRQKIADIEEIRADMSVVVSSWFSKNLPGVFSSGLLRGEFPTSELISFCEASPHEHQSAANDADSEYVRMLMLTNGTNVWHSRTCQGLSIEISLLGRSEMDSAQFHSSFTFNKSMLGANVLSVDSSDRLSLTNYIDNHVSGTLSLWAISPMLYGYAQHLKRIRQLRFSKGASGRNSVKSLERISEHVSDSIDVGTIIDELTSAMQDGGSIGWDIEEFDPHMPWQSELKETLHNQIGDDAVWLQSINTSIRDNLARYGSMLSATEDIRLQKKIAFLTMVLFALSTLIALENSFLQKVFQWVVESNGEHLLANFIDRAQHISAVEACR